jgi:chaperonin GroES
VIGAIMENLTNSITIDEETINSPNLCDRFTEEDLKCIGSWAADRYRRDIQSRERWYNRNKAGMDLAMQVQKNKTFPWPNCSNIAFPLVTIAALQFHARAYPAIVNGRNPVKCQIFGPDPDGNARLRSNAIAEHMNFQLLELDSGWEEDTDRALLNVSIIGTGFKKTSFNSDKAMPVSEFVSAENFVLDYWARSVDECDCKTHIIPLYRNAVHSNVKRGKFVDILKEAWYEQGGTPSQEQQSQHKDDRAGTARPPNDYDTPFTFLEQHTFLDLDCDGYAEPVIITLEEATETVVRIVLRFDREEDIERNREGEIVCITPNEYFTKIPFIPSPDGGIYDYGFGVLLGPLNESVNGAINQLFDAGTLANTAGGFLGRGAKLKGGVYQFRPFEWNRVDATGDDLRKSIFPLPVREPSNVMFQLLGLLIDYTNRISGTTDMMVGENPGQNTPAETARTMTTQGQKIYSAIFKRIWRSAKGEFKKLYNLNGRFLPASVPYGEGKSITREMYSAGGAHISPSADPLVVSDEARFAQAAAVRAAAAGNNAYDADAVERQYLQALGVNNIDEVYKGVENAPPSPPDVRVQIEQLRLQSKAEDRQMEMQKFMIDMQRQAQLDNAKIVELMAKAASIEAGTETEKGNVNINAFRAGIEYLREQNKSADSRMKMMKEMLGGPGVNIPIEGDAAGNASGVEGAPSDSILSGVGQNSTGSIEGSMG